MRNIFPFGFVCAGIVCCSLTVPLLSQAQNHAAASAHHRPADEPLEKTGDAYLPNAYNDQKTSTPYVNHAATLRNTSIATVQVNVNNAGQNIVGDAANEPNLAVNPLDTNQMVIGWRQFDNVASNFRQAGWAYTTDGGLTWTFPGKIEAGIFRSDPVLDFDNDGDFYYNSLSIANNGDYVCKVFKSINGGATWDAGTDAHGGDKQWMTIDRTAGIGQGNIYSFWTSYYSSCFPGFFTRSTDENASYESCTEIPGSPYWGTMAVDKQGTLYVAGGDYYSGITVSKSVTAQDSGAMVNWTPDVSVFLDGTITYGNSVNPDGLLGQVNIDVDRSEGPGQGNVYLLASLRRISVSDLGDVMFARSTDGGATWSAPQKINDDASTSNTQWFGTMAVAPNGRIDAVWLDTRDHPYSDSSALYYSYSLDEGSTWSVNEKLSDSFDPNLGYPNQNKMGDYFDMVSDNSGVSLAWANTFNGEQDVYYSRITPGVAAYVNADPGIGFSVYPNPSAGVFVFTATGSMKPLELEVRNELGVLLFALENSKANTTIDLSSRPPGIYFLRVTDATGHVLTKKLVKN